MLDSWTPVQKYLLGVIMLLSSVDAVMYILQTFGVWGVRAWWITGLVIGLRLPWTNFGDFITCVFCWPWVVAARIIKRRKNAP